jgi:hypothetical protein
VRAGQARQIPDEVRQQKARLDIVYVELSINFDFHLHTCFSFGDCMKFGGTARYCMLTM